MHVYDNWVLNVGVYMGFALGLITKTQRVVHSYISSRKTESICLLNNYIELK